MDRKTAFITGATSGIGAAFAKYYAKEGYDLIITGHPEDKILLPIQDLRKKFNVNIEVILVELSDESKLLELEEILTENKGIEVLINNAGYLNRKPFLENEKTDMERMIKVHINVPVRLIHAVLPNMISKNHGIIINLSSLAAFTPFPSYPMYPSTKLFHCGFMESLHITLKDKGIKVQALCPGFVYSNFHKKAGVKLSDFKNKAFTDWMTPERVVEISVGNLKKRNKVIVIPGVTNNVLWWIQKIIPKVLYYKLASRFLN